MCFAHIKSPKFKSPFRKILDGAKTVDCSGDGTNKCMMVKNSPEKNWEIFYDQIKGDGRYVYHGTELLFSF